MLQKLSFVVICAKILTLWVVTLLHMPQLQAFRAWMKMEQHIKLLPVSNSFRLVTQWQEILQKNVVSLKKKKKKFFLIDTAPPDFSITMIHTEAETFRHSFHHIMAHNIYSFSYNATANKIQQCRAYQLALLETASVILQVILLPLSFTYTHFR